MRLQYAYILASAVTVSVAGCSSSTPDPCGGMTAACITARVEGTAKKLDQLRFTVVQPATASITTPTTPAAFSLPVEVGVEPPSGAPNGFDLLLEGLSAGVSVASDHQTITLTANREHVTFTLNAGTELDLAVPENPDLMAPDDLQSPPPIVITASPAPAVVRELETLTLTVTATDPTGQAVTMGLSDTPAGGAVNGTGATSVFLWTPDFTAFGQTAGVKATATAQDASRDLVQTIPIQVLNSADKVFLLNPNDALGGNQPPTVAIGDFDGDGYGDLASCESTNFGATPKYSLYVLFGGPNGLPATLPAMPMPGTNYVKYTFDGTFSTSANAPRLSCIGGDFDGDGKADVVIADSKTTNGHGALYILFGDTDRTKVTPLALPLADNSGFAGTESFGIFPLFTGDFNGDGKADFATQTSPTSSTDNVYIFSIKGVSFDKASPPATLLTPGQLANSRHTASEGNPCNRRQIEGFGNIDATPGEELLLYDPGVMAGTCNSAGVGGVSVLRDGLPDLLFVHPAGTSTNFGINSALCDVDGDGLADLVVVDGAPGANHAYTLFTAASPSPSPFPIASGIVLSAAPGPRAHVIDPTPANHVYQTPVCVKKFFGAAPATLLLVDPGDNNTVPGRVDVISSSLTPAVARTLPNPTGTPPDLNYGSVLGGATDIDKDGRNDLVIGSAHGMWAIYGR